MTMPIQEPTDAALVFGYEHIVTQNKNNTDVIQFNVVKKNIELTTKNNTYNSVQ